MIECTFEDTFTGNLGSFIRHIRVKQFSTIRTFCKEKGLTFTLFSVVHHLAVKKEVSVTDLGKFLSVSNAAVSQITDKLVALGYITRNESIKDRRVKVIALSERGEELISDLHQKSNEWLGELESQFSQDEKALILDALKLFNNKFKGETFRC